MSFSLVFTGCFAPDYDRLRRPAQAAAASKPVPIRSAEAGSGASEGTRSIGVDGSLVVPVVPVLEVDRSTLPPPAVVVSVGSKALSEAPPLVLGVAVSGLVELAGAVRSEIWMLETIDLTTLIDVIMPVTDPTGAEIAMIVPVEAVAGAVPPAVTIVVE